MTIPQKLAIVSVGLASLAIGFVGSIHTLSSPKSLSLKQQAYSKSDGASLTDTDSSSLDSTLHSYKAMPVVAQTVSTGFVTPSGNIHCALVGDNKNALRCEINSGLNPKPPQPYPGYCEFDWGAGFWLPKSGNPKILCISDTIAGSSYSTLSYGSTWKKAGFQCVSRTTGLTCTNSSGQGFFLSRERWKVLTNPR